jgi:CrcB protein
MGLPLSGLSLAAIFCGAGLGALLRVWFNTVSVGFSAIVPMGTFISNLLGCYLVGIAVAFFANHPAVSSEWRLFIITGFLGGLTTFSSFSAEVVSLLERGQLTWGLGLALMHVCGAIALTLLGIWTYQSFK